MLRRGFTSTGARPRISLSVGATLGATARPVQLSGRRLFANTGSTPPPTGGSKVFGLLVGAAVVASGWTGYRYATEPPFRSRLNDFWASLSVPYFTTTPAPAREGSSPSAPSLLDNEEVTEVAPPVPPSATPELLALRDETSFAQPPQTTHEEAVVALSESAAVEEDESISSAHTLEPSAEQETAHESTSEQTQEGEEFVHTGPPEVVVMEEEELAQPAPAVEVHFTPPAEITDADEPQPAAVPAAVVAFLTESFAASDAHQEAVAASACHEEATHSDAAETKHQPQEEEQQQQQQQEEKKNEQQAVADHATRLQELQAIREIIAIQAESCDHRVKKKVERLRQKYEQQMTALREQVDELVAEHVDVERHKLAEEFQNRYHQELESLQQQFMGERQRVYAEMEDMVAGLNARFVDLVREEKQLLQDQLDESAKLHTHTLAYLQTLVEDAEYRSRHLGEEREMWSWTERLAGAVRALESAALGPDGHLHPFQAELELVRSLAATRPVYKAVAQHIEEHAPRGVYSVGRLRERFEQVEKPVRVAALVPEGGGLLSHAVAPLLAATASINPYHKPTSQELLLDSARRHLQEDDLLSALHDMEQLTGLAHELANDWVEEARKRLTVEQAISVISADLAAHKPPSDL